LHDHHTGELLAELGRLTPKALTIVSPSAIEAYSDLRPSIEDIRADGLSFGAIAKRLNTPRPHDATRAAVEPGAGSSRPRSPRCSEAPRTGMMLVTHLQVQCELVA
jgi:hypothetical protein